MPDVNYDSVKHDVVHPDVLGEGLVVEHEDKLTCMEFYPVTRWYPRVGLGAGVLLAVGLGWLNLRRSAKIPVALQATHRGDDT